MEIISSKSLHSSSEENLEFCYEVEQIHGLRQLKAVPDKRNFRAEDKY